MQDKRSAIKPPFSRECRRECRLTWDEPHRRSHIENGGAELREIAHITHGQQCASIISSFAESPLPVCFYFPWHVTLHVRAERRGKSNGKLVGSPIYRKKATSETEPFTENHEVWSAIDRSVASTRVWVLLASKTSFERGFSTKKKPWSHGDTSRRSNNT